MKDSLLLPFETLEKYLRHASPVVRDWAWERLEEIYPERLPEFVPLALEERDPKVFQTILRILKDHASLLSPELQESLKNAVLERLHREKSRDLLLWGLRFLGTIASLCEVLAENSWLAERVFTDEKFSYLFFTRIFYELPISEREALHALLDEPIPEWEAHSAGYRIWETADPSPIKEVYVRLHDEIPHILPGLEIVLPKKDYFLGILPEKVARAFTELEKEKNRRLVRSFVEEEFEKLRKEVIERRGEVNLKRHLARPRSLGVLFRTLETLLSISAGDYSQPVVETLGLLFLTLLWGKPLLGLPQNISPEELLNLYLKKERPSFPEDEELRERILASLESEKDFEARIREHLREVLSEDSYGAERALELVQECGRTFLPEILDFFEKSVKDNLLDREYIEEALRPWLREEEVRRRLLEIVERHRDCTVFFLLAHYPTSEAALSLAENFEAWMRQDLETLGLLASLFPHPGLWEKMKRFVHPRLLDWKRTFIVYAYLFEPDFPGLKDLEKEAWETTEDIVALLSGEKPGSPMPVTVTLGCKECAYYFPFKPRIVLIGEEDPDLPERVVCPRCGAEDRFFLSEIEKGRLKTQWLIFRPKGGEIEEWKDGVWPVKELIVTVKGRRQTFTRYREALAYYRRMVEVHAGDPEVLSGYLHLLLKGRRLEEAEKALEQLERLKPDCVDYIYLRAVYHRLRGEPEKALEFYRQAVEALARGAPFYRFYPQESAEALRAIFFEARDYARVTGKAFSINEDLLWKKKKVGRNDPCPCGSGKKYKKCCLKKKEGALPEKKSAQSAEERKAFRLYEEFVARKYKRELYEFLDRWIPQFEEASRELDSERDWLSYIEEMFLFFGRGESGVPLVEDFLKTKGRNLSRAEREILASLPLAYPGLYETLEVEEKEGKILLKDRLTGEVFSVRDYSLSRRLAPGERLWTMLFRVGDHWRPSRISFSVPLFKEPLVYQKLKELLEASGEKDYPSFARKHPLKVSLEVVKILFSPLDLRLITPEGDEVVLVRAHYELLDPELENLFPTGDFVKGEEHEYVLIEPVEGSIWSTGHLPSERESPPGTIVLQARYMGKYLEIGRVEFLPEKKRVRLEALSRSRMERLRRAFEEVAGEGARFLVEEITDFKKLMKRSSGKKEEIPDEEAAELRWLEYLAWLDTPEPELGGRTPREAWRDLNLRSKVEEMLRRFAFLEKQFEREGRTHLKIRKLRSLLEGEGGAWSS